VTNPKINALDKKDGQQVKVSPERVRVLDADVIVFATDEKDDSPEKLLKVPTVPRIPAVAQNRAVYTDEILAGAIYFISPLSLPYVLDRLTPQLVAALAGRVPREPVDAAPRGEHRHHASARRSPTHVDHEEHRMTITIERPVHETALGESAMTARAASSCSAGCRSGRCCWPAAAPTNPLATPPESGFLSQSTTSTAARRSPRNQRGS